MKETFLYIEFTVFCLFILIAILYRINQDPDQSNSNCAFRRVVISVLYATLLDCFWEAFNGSAIPYGRQLNALINVLCLVSYGVIGYFWLAYVEAFLSDTSEGCHRSGCSRWLPLALCLGMAMASLHDDWIIQFDENNQFRPGTAYPLIVILPCINLLMASYKIIRHYRIANTPQKKEDDLMMLSFLFLPLLGGIISSIYNDIPAVWPLCILSLLIIYINNQGHRISTDSLTGLNNRFKLDSYLSSLSTAKNLVNTTYLFICDLDNFKQINDTYGHQEGDLALREASQVLKHIIGRDDFLARYGGDEFILITTCASHDAALDFRQKIKQAFAQQASQMNHPYQIGISIGLSLCDADITTCFQRADEQLYIEKSNKKSASSSQPLLML